MTSTTRVQKLRLGLTSRSRLKLRSKESLRPPSSSKSAGGGSLSAVFERLEASAGVASISAIPQRASPAQNTDLRNTDSRNDDLRHDDLRANDLRNAQLGMHLSASLEEVEISAKPDKIRCAVDGRADRADALREASISGIQPDPSQMVLQLGVENLRIVVRGRGGDGIAERAAESSRN